MGWETLANVTVGVHEAFLLYLVVGGFLAWRWPRTLVLHIAAAVWAVLIVVTRVPCPLTWAQNGFRHRAGLPDVTGGFIATYVRGVVYPAGAEVAVQVAVGVVVLASWVGLVVRRRTHAPLSAR